ncbi:hypothetical protein BH11GEM1_BH11GEM1_07710 [soil metagenome]
MTTLTRLLFPQPAIRRSPATLFAWWEARRPIYNAVVGNARSSARDSSSASASRCSPLASHG